MSVATSRRRVLAVLLTAPILARAQKRGALPRVGLLFIRAAGTEIYIRAFRDGMQALGYFDGRNVIIDERFMVNSYDGLDTAAAGLAKSEVAVIVTYGSTSLRAARKMAPGVPIVMFSGGDVLQSGAAASLSRPGGNVTGISSISLDLSGKRLELLMQVIPTARRIAVPYYPGSPGEALALQNYEAAARALKLQLRPIAINSPAEIETALASISAADVQGLTVIGSTMFNANRKRFLSAVGKLRLPAIYASSEYVDEGGLLSYGINFMDAFRGVAKFVAKILEGTKPGDIPIEQAAKVELAVNLRTARALGLAVPASVRLRADKLIE